MEYKADRLDILYALKKAYLIAYDAYLKSKPEEPEMSRNHQNMVCTRRAYRDACVEFCDELIIKHAAEEDINQT